MVNTWWVNQRDRDVSDIWGPERSRSGALLPARTRIKEARINDLIFHNYKHQLVAISQVVAPAYFDVRPPDEGYKLPVTSTVLSQPFALGSLKPDEIMTGPGTPFKTGKNEAQQGYFFAVPAELAQFLFACLGMDGVNLEADTETGASITLEGRTDADVISTVRREQPLLRARLLAGHSEAPCSLCGRTLPSSYLVVSHIKRRSECSEQERLDPNIAMLSCLLGCDAAFERGDIFADEAGILRVREHAPSIIHELFAPYAGQQVPSHSAATAAYFEHRRHSNE